MSCEVLLRTIFSLIVGHLITYCRNRLISREIFTLEIIGFTLHYIVVERFLLQTVLYQNELLNAK